MVPVAGAWECMPMSVVEVPVVGVVAVVVVDVAL